MHPPKAREETAATVSILNSSATSNLAKKYQALADLLSAEIALKIWMFYEPRTSNSRVPTINAVRLREVEANGA